MKRGDAMKIEDLGFDGWFGEQAAGLSMDGCGFARVSAVDRGSYLVMDGVSEVQAELAGKLAHRIGDSEDLPCVGDWVTVRHYNDGTAAIIHRVFPRRSFLRRSASEENGGCQMIAANIDTAFIVQSCHYDFNPNRLERYLVMAAEGRVRPVVIITKTDLVSRDELIQKLSILGSVTRAEVIAISNITGEGSGELQNMLAPGKTYCLLGSSGVGKTTIINCLIGREAFETRTVSGTGEGTHTTSRRQLIVLSRGAMLIDTPGMRALGIAGAGEGMETGFEKIAALSAKCRYADCSHEHEPRCAVRAAVEGGELHQGRYSSFMKLKKESEYSGMSELERRKKDKAFGKFLKSAKKQIKK